MAETYQINEDPIKARLLSLYMDTCILVSAMRTQMNLKQFAEARFTFHSFRINMTEMYYLTLSIEKLKGEATIQKISSWSKMECGNRCSKKFIRASIRLFEDYAELLSGGFFHE